MKKSLNPLAIELNEIIAKESPTIFKFLSKKGRDFFYPTKGILVQSAEAKKMADPRYNATVGIATNKDGPLSFSSIEEFFNLDLLTPSQIFNYSPTMGQAKLRELWKQHIIQVNPNIANKTISTPLVGAGLTHCLSMIGELFFEEGKTLIMADQIWGNYRLLYQTLHDTQLRHFNFLNEKGIDLLAFEEVVRDEAKKTGEVRLLLNFPNNPTGYAPTKSEAQSMVKVLNQLAEEGHRVLVILDEAYYGLFFEEDLQKHSIFGELCNLHENLLCVKVCGSTKEFFAWGFRVGFITLGIKGGNTELYQALEKKIGGIARASISNCSTVSQNILIKILEKQNYLDDLKKNFQILKKRANHIKQILDKKNYDDVFEAYPFNSGYFMLIKLKNGIKAEDLRKELLIKEKIGTIATATHDLRIAFSCLELEDIDHVFEKIYHIAKSMN